MSWTVGSVVTILFFSLMSAWAVIAWPARTAAIPLLILLFFPYWQLYLKRDLLPEWMQEKK